MDELAPQRVTLDAAAPPLHRSASVELPCSCASLSAAAAAGLLYLALGALVSLDAALWLCFAGSPLALGAARWRHSKQAGAGREREELLYGDSAAGIEDGERWLLSGARAAAFAALGYGARANSAFYGAGGKGAAKQVTRAVVLCCWWCWWWWCWWWCSWWCCCWCCWCCLCCLC